ncbi:MAG: hypothetical protein VCE43_06460, partial [Myxococcota bacterium]
SNWSGSRWMGTYRYPSEGFAAMREKLGVPDTNIGFEAYAALQIAARLEPMFSRSTQSED